MKKPGRKEAIPVYDICSIDRSANPHLLIERFGDYLQKHYAHLHRPHRHSFYHLVLFTAGEGSHSIDFERFPVEPYQIYFMSPGQVHSWHFEGGVDGFIVHFDASLLSSFLQNGHYLERFSFFSGNPAESVCLIPPARQSELHAVFESLVSEYKSSKPGSLDLIRVKLLEVFLLVNRGCEGAGGAPGVEQKRNLLRQFRGLIESNFRTLRLPKEYAFLLYVTPNHLNALCRELAGKTAGDLIRDRVVLEAKRLLTNADLTIAGIADELHFEDNSYFARFFKKYTGFTPEAFRNEFIHAKS